MRDVAEMMELASTLPRVEVLPQEYVRLLGYPRGWELEGRALELADWARDWYAKNGKPWFYARQAENFEFDGESIQIDGMPFTSKRLQSTLEQAEAHSVILVAVGAGPEAEEEAAGAGRKKSRTSISSWRYSHPQWSSIWLQRPERVSATGQNSTTWRCCRTTAQDIPNGMLRSNRGLLELMKRTRREPFPSPVEVFDSGMLRPKKTLLAVFGLTRHTDRLRRLTDLVPCENCSFGPCQYRRAPYRRAPRSWGEASPGSAIPALDQDAEYSVNRRALKRWAEERLSMHREPGRLARRSVPL